MKQLILIFAAASLIFETSCKKEEVMPPPTSKINISENFDENDWNLMQKNYQEDGMVGDLFQSKTDKKQTLFYVRKTLTRAIPAMTGTYTKHIIHLDPEDPTVIAVVHSCDGSAKNCYIDGKKNIVVAQK